MNYTEARSLIPETLTESKSQIRWCNEERFRDENMEGVSPGGHLNPWSYFVIATTIGGNSILLKKDDPRVFFADQGRYLDESIEFEESNKWLELPYSDENVARSLTVIGESVSDFSKRIKSGEIDQLLDEID